MKFATWMHNGKEEAGILAADGHSVHPFAAAGLGEYGGLLTYIKNHSKVDDARLKSVAQTPGIPLADVTFLAPIPRVEHDIVCLGLNYRDHVDESPSFDASIDPNREKAAYFSKRASRPIGAGGVIESHRALDPMLDYEAELAVVLGKTAHGVKRKDAFSHVFGLCCFNDITARTLQKSHTQWFFGKSLDTFTAFGPWIVTMDEFSLPLRLSIASRVNGEERQHSNTANMIFPIDAVISELSAGMTLDAGSIIATGTPGGVGIGFTPPRCLTPGDVVEIEIEGIGTLRNIVGE